jgi:predicted nucleic acid-binding Zn ribbon protein
LSPGRGGSGRSEEPQALGSVLDVLGAERRLGAGLLLGALGRRWEAVVGLRLAEESAPVGLDDGVLLVRASSSAWAAQIRFLSKEITEGANRVLAAGSGGGSRGGSGEALHQAHKAPIREVRVVVDSGPRTA